MLRVHLPLSRDCNAVSIPFPVPSLISTAACGDMRARRRIDFLISAGYDPARTIMLRQEHTRRVVTVNEARDSVALRDPEDRIAADGVISPSGGPALAVGVGDCMPIFLFDRESGAYGLLHSGWKGTGILEDAVRRMGEEFRSDPGSLIVHFGPCISAVAYQVDEKRAEIYGGWGSGSVVYRNDRPYLDLRAANRNIADRLGITEVSVADHCTFTDERLGSFRREGPEYSGMIAVVGERKGSNEAIQE